MLLRRHGAVQAKEAPHSAPEAFGHLVTCPGHGGNTGLPFWGSGRTAKPAWMTSTAVSKSASDGPLAKPLDQLGIRRGVGRKVRG